ncbi:hypothetical protein F8M41_006424 [Gigaspora margarita]|uniref:Uncharacterized protein n=1 Tax=Gigaspora margarita TaxID=4874 RepID=A0A8H4AWS6_GIGMA|nr:hypothetical protein F8M41_006424 [Gigaspora margarita]
MYIVDLTIGTCSCFVSISESSYKYQAAIALKFQKGTLNFINILTINDRINYFYLATGIVIQERLFYTSLRSQTNITFNNNTVDQLKIQKFAIPKSVANTKAIISEKINDIKQNEQLLSAFEKFQKGYCTTKNISENKLVSFV